MRIELQKGDEPIAAEFPQNTSLLLPAPYDPPADSEETILQKALRRPIGAKALRKLVSPGMKIAVVTSDITRPMPSWKVLPPVLEELWAAGVVPEDVTVVFALGSHRPHTEEERRRLAGEEVFDKVRCIDSDMDDCAELGVTPQGTPVDVFRPVAEADFVICLGNIEYHYFMGYSGGIKAVMPGVSSLRAITRNHAGMVLPEARSGRLDGNPVREDIEEAAAFRSVGFLVNVVLDEHQRILHAVAGDVVEAHRAGCSLLDKLYGVPIRQKFDIVAVSPGGFPKDLNMYQAQKALENAGEAVRDYGVILWVASCREGLGSGPFERWMTTMTDEEMIAGIRDHFELGGHKAAAIALLRRRADIFLISDLDPEMVKTLGFHPYPTLQSALDAAIRRFVCPPDLLVMPHGGSTLPILPQP